MVKHRRVSARAGRESEDAGGSPSSSSKLIDAYVHRPRARTVATRPLVLPPTLRERHEGTQAPRSLPVLTEERPRTRGECMDGPRPCPWVSCRHHLAFELVEYSDLPKKTARLLIENPHGEPDQLPETCSLDVADRGVHTLEQVSHLFGLTRERIRQIEAKAVESPLVRRMMRAWQGHATDVDMARGEVGQGIADTRESLR